MPIIRLCSVLPCFLALIVCQPVTADIITFITAGAGGAFDFQTGSGTFTDVSGSVADGLQITVQSFVDGVASGLVNADGIGLGVNAATSEDLPARLDGGVGLESLTFSFNDLATIDSIFLTEVDLVAFTAIDTGTLTVDGTTSALSGLATTTVPIHSNLEGNSFTIAHTGGNGFGIESLTFDITPAISVPEPSSLTFFGLVAGGLIIGRVRRRRKTTDSSAPPKFRVTVVGTGHE